jgi:diguanylate cyclase (GGDEF)-like protein/PAS domain S-box-containing protein
MVQRNIAMMVESSRHTISWVSSGFTDALGWRIDDVLHCSVLDLVHADDSFRLLAMVAPGDADQHYQSLVLRLRRRDGGWQRCELESVRRLDTSVRSSTFLRLRLAHDAAGDDSEAERRFTTLAFGSVDAVVVHDGIDILFANESTAQMLGTTGADALIGLPIASFTRAEDRVALDEERRRFEADPSHTARLDLGLRHVDGSVVPVRATLSLVEWRGKPAVQGLFRSLVPESNAAQSAAVRQQLERAVSDAIIVTDASFRIESWNHAAAALYGWTAAEVLGRRVSDVIGAMDPPQVTEERSASLFTHGHWQGQALHHHRKGWPIRVEAHVALLRGADGEVVGVVSVNHAARPNPVLAERDALTDLWGRATLIEVLSATPDDHAAMLAVVDVDHFTGFNARFGPATGDVVLVEIARRLSSAARANDVVARLGGDRFAVYGQVEQLSEAKAFAARLARIVNEPVVHDGHTLRVSSSIGVAWAGDDRSSSRLLEHAEHAVKQSKISVGRGVLFFLESPVDTDEWANDDQFEAELRDAIGAGDFTVAYQPIVELQSGRVFKLEALARWSHPVRGVLSPSLFVPIAERTGAINLLGRWVLQRSCTELVAAGDELESVVLCVNVSPLQLADAAFVDDVDRILRDTGLPASRLWLEVTESALVTDAAIEPLHQLQRLGINIAIDDFGTGYATLQQIGRLPVDAVKIDRSFVAGLGIDPSDTAIVRSVVNLARELGLTVIAEGVETEAQRAQLVALNCRLAQGWLFGRAVPMADVAIPRRSPRNALAIGLDGPASETDERRRLAALYACKILDTSPEPEFDLLADMAARLLGMPIAVIAFTDEHRRWCKALVGIDGLDELPRHGALIEHAAVAGDESSEVVVVADTHAEQEGGRGPLLQGPAHVRAYASAAVRSREGLCIGAITVLDSIPHDLDEQQRWMLRSVAQQITALVDLRRRTVELADLARVPGSGLRPTELDTSMIEHTSDVILVIDQSATLRYANDAARTVLGYEPRDWIGRDCLELVHPDDLAETMRALGAAASSDRASDTRMIRVARSDGSWCPFEVRAHASPDSGDGLMLVITARDLTDHLNATGRIGRQREFIDITLDNLTDAVVGCDASGTITVFNLAARRLHGMNALPADVKDWAATYGLLSGDGRRLLELDEVPLFRALRGERVVDQEVVVSPPGRPPRLVRCTGQQLNDPSGEVIGAVVVSHDITSQREVEQLLRHQALHDHLTGLSNRHHLMPYLDRLLLEDPTSVSVAFIDLDRLKSVNDRYGHRAGDHLLTAVAQRLSAVARSRDLVSRLGGDEFAVVRVTPHDQSDRDDAEFIERVRECTRFVTQFEGFTFDVSASVGAVRARPFDTSSSLLSRADEAMYLEKVAGNAFVRTVDGGGRTGADRDGSAPSALSARGRS